MSDQLSKVDKPAPNWCPRCHKRPDDVTFCTHEFHRIESATTPAEVGEVDAAASNLNLAAVHAKPEHKPLIVDAIGLIRTLARQLAEAKASSPRYHVVEAVKLGNSELVTAEKVDALKMTNLEGWRLAQQRGIQLEQAESQLAKATRRLGEVEGLVNDALALQQKHYGDGMDTHMALADWARNAKAAIDARLASDSEGVPARRRNPMEWDARAAGEGEGNG